RRCGFEFNLGTLPLRVDLENWAFERTACAFGGTWVGYWITRPTSARARVDPELDNPGWRSAAGLASRQSCAPSPPATKACADCSPNAPANVPPWWCGRDARRNRRIRLSCRSHCVRARAPG